MRLFDDDGNEKQIFSFVQIRGSIPLYWEQNEWWKLRPSIILTNQSFSSHLLPLRSHLNSLCNDYILKKNLIPTSPTTTQTLNVPLPFLLETDSDIAIVNLIDKKGTQGALGLALSASLLRLQDSISKSDPQINETSLLNRNVTTIQNIGTENHEYIYIYIKFNSLISKSIF